MNIANRRARARYAIAFAAADRWAKRLETRGDNKRDVAEAGPGAADSLARRKDYVARETTRKVARELSGQGLLSRALERRIGLSLDLDIYPPSEQARRAGRPVARITRGGGGDTEGDPIATGFLVAQGLLLTNHHVLPTKAEAVGLSANFLYEYSERGLARGRYHALDPDSFFHSDQSLDFALVAINPIGQDGGPLDDLGLVSLIEATPKVLVGQPVNIIQHPQGRGKSYAIRENRLVDILDTGFLHYETDTLGGSSGSPAFSQNWELVALHHSGVPNIVDGKIFARNGAEWDPETMTDDDVEWVANEGIRVSAIVGALRELKMAQPDQQVRLDKLIGSTGDPLRVVERIAQVTPNNPTLSGGAAVSQNNFYFSGPVTINIIGGSSPAIEATPAAIAAIATPPIQALEKKQNFDRNYAKRKGYDPNFLGLSLPPPVVSAGRLDEMYRDHDGAVLALPYHHFSIAMNETRRMCMWAASNADYSAAVRDDRPRAAFGGEDWRLDPRLPEELQIQNDEFYGPARRIDRGHVVRRDDNCWGATPLEIEYANADSYHWSNCTPQHEAFNQEHAQKAEYKGVVGIWGGLESLIAKALEKHDFKATIFAGPVLDNQNDPRADLGGGEIQYPTRFWKIIAIAAEPGAASAATAYGFVLDQGDVLARFGIEAIDVSPFKAHQYPVAEIEALTGLRFAQPLHDGDVLRGSPSQQLETAENITFKRASTV